MSALPRTVTEGDDHSLAAVGENNNGLMGWWCGTNNGTEDVCVVVEELLPLELTTTTTPTQIKDPIDCETVQREWWWRGATHGAHYNNTNNSVFPTNDNSLNMIDYKAVAAWHAA